MNYALIQNGEVKQIGLPATGYLKDGSGVSGYNLLHEDILKEEGWLPCIDNRPTFNQETEYLQFDGYVISETQVTANYIVVAKQPQGPTIEERISAVEEVLLTIL